MHSFAEQVSAAALAAARALLRSGLGFSQDLVQPAICYCAFKLALMHCSWLLTVGCTFRRWYSTLVMTLLAHSVPDLFCKSPIWRHVNKLLAFVLVIAVAIVMTLTCVQRMSQALARHQFSWTAANAIHITATNCQARAAASDSLVCHRCQTPWGNRTALFAAK